MQLDNTRVQRILARNEHVQLNQQTHESWQQFYADCRYQSRVENILHKHRRNNTTVIAETPLQVSKPPVYSESSSTPPYIARKLCMDSENKKNYAVSELHDVVVNDSILLYADNDDECHTSHFDDDIVCSASPALAHVDDGIGAQLVQCECNQISLNDELKVEDDIDLSPIIRGDDNSYSVSPMQEHAVCIPQEACCETVSFAVVRRLRLGNDANDSMTQHEEESDDDDDDDESHRFIESPSIEWK